MSSLLSAHELAHALGGRSIGRGQFMAKCPAHKENTGSLSIKDGHVGVLIHCFGGCLQSDVIHALQDLDLWPRYNLEQDREEARRKRQDRDRKVASERVDDEAKSERSEADRVAYVRKVWREAVDPRGTLAEVYLAGRGLALPAELCGRVLRFHPRCPWEQQKVPALIAAFLPIEEPDPDALPVALWRRGLTADGKKLGKPKALGPVKGAVIKLDADESVEQYLGISQSLEDGLDVRQRGWQPMWCASGDGALSVFPAIPPLCLTIFPDTDTSGLRAALACARRWKDANLQVKIVPPAGAKDWNEAGR